MYISAKIVTSNCTHFSSVESGQMCEVGTLYTKCVKWGPYTPNV